MILIAFILIVHILSSMVINVCQSQCICLLLTQGTRHSIVSRDNSFLFSYFQCNKKSRHSWPIGFATCTVHTTTVQLSPQFHSIKLIIIKCTFAPFLACLKSMYWRCMHLSEFSIHFFFSIHFSIPDGLVSRVNALLISTLQSIDGHCAK